MQQSNIVSRSRMLNGARKIYWNVGNPIYIRNFSKENIYWRGSDTLQSAGLTEAPYCISSRDILERNLTY